MDSPNSIPGTPSSPSCQTPNDLHLLAVCSTLDDVQTSPTEHCSPPTDPLLGNNACLTALTTHQDEIPPTQQDYPDDGAGSTAVHAAELVHSTTAQQCLGKRVPDNTRRANYTALKLFSGFVVSMSSDMQEISSDALACLAYTRRLIFPGDAGDVLPSGYSAWTVEQLKKIRFYLINLLLTTSRLRKMRKLSPQP